MYKKNLSNKMVMRLLRESGACADAREWVKQHGGTSSDLWRDCQRGDWMNWIIVKKADFFGITRPRLVGALAECAELVLPIYEKKNPNDPRVRNCIETCKRFSRGEANAEELDAAAYAAAYAAANAATYAAYAAANAATYAAYAANDAATYAANAATYAAYYAAYYAYDAAEAKKETLKQCADILRKYFDL